MRVATLFMDTMFHGITPFLPLLASLTLVIVILAGLHFFLLAKPVHLTQQQKLPRQLSMLVLTLIGLVVIAITTSPIKVSTNILN